MPIVNLFFINLYTVYKVTLSLKIGNHNSRCNDSVKLPK